MTNISSTKVVQILGKCWTQEIYCRHEVEHRNIRPPFYKKPYGKKLETRLWTVLLRECCLFKQRMLSEVFQQPLTFSRTKGIWNDVWRLQSLNWLILLLTLLRRLQHLGSVERPFEPAVSTFDSTSKLWTNFRNFLLKSVLDRKSDEWLKSQYSQLPSTNIALYLFVDQSGVQHKFPL